MQDFIYERKEQSMIELRWLVDDLGNRVLQYRQEYNATVYGGNPSDEFRHQTRQRTWSKWRDVPVVPVVPVKETQ